MSKETEKRNDFDKIIDELGSLVNDDDLKRILDTKIDIHQKRSLWMLGIIFPLAALLINFEIPQFSDSKMTLLFLAALFGMYIIFIIIVNVALTWNPFSSQKPIFINYIKARNRLRCLKESESSRACE